MKEEEDLRGLAPGNTGPFAGDATEIHALDRHVVGDRPDRSDLVEALPPFGPTGRARFEPSSSRMASISVWIMRRAAKSVLVVPVEDVLPFRGVDVQLCDGRRGRAGLSGEDGTGIPRVSWQ